MTTLAAENKGYTRLIIVLSVAIPLAVAVLLFAPQKFLEFGSWVKNLPALNAILNSLTTVLLIAAVVAIKKGNIMVHKSLMTTAFILGSLFLVSYVLYHSSVPSVKFGDIDGNGILSDQELAEVGGTRMFYLGVLLSHIGLSIVVVPFVLFAFYYSLTGKIEKHRKIVKFTFPIWLYVSVTGVLTYLLISPYYQ